MEFIKKLVLYGFAVLLPATLIAAPGNLRLISVQGSGAVHPEMVPYPDYLENVFTLDKVSSSIDHKNLVESVKLLIHTLDFERNNQKDVIGKLAFIEQSICKTSSLEVIRKFHDLALRIGYKGLAHVVYWNALYQARLKGQVVPQDGALESLDASDLNLSTIDFRVLRSIFPNLKKINLRGNPIQKVSYSFFNAGCSIEIDETAPVYASSKFSALWAGVRILKDLSGVPRFFAQSLLSPLVYRDNKQSLIGSLISCIAPDFARNSIEQYWHDCVYRSAMGSLIPRAASFTVQLVRPWFYYPLHDVTRSLLARYNLGTSAVGKILYPFGLTAICGWLNRYAYQIPGVDEITHVWDFVHDSLARNVPFKAQVIGALGLIAVTGVADYIHYKTTPATIKVHRI